MNRRVFWDFLAVCSFARSLATSNAGAVPRRKRGLLGDAPAMIETLETRKLLSAQAVITPSVAVTNSSDPPGEIKNMMHGALNGANKGADPPGEMKNVLFGALQGASKGADPPGE